MNNKFNRFQTWLFGLLFTAIILAFFIGNVQSKATPPPPSSSPFGQTGYWVSIFADEFDGSTLDSDKWVSCYWWDNNGCTISSNNELEWYQPENVLLNDGILTLRAEEKPITGTTGIEYPYTSGMVTTGKDNDDSDTDHKFIFQYGYAEIRARIPAGQGLWPAFWLLPAAHVSKPEIDVMEIIGSEPTVQHMNFHYRDSEGETVNIGEEWDGDDFSADWHIFGVDWQPEAIVWYVDGIERWRFEEMEHIPAEPLYLLLNLAVGGDWPGSPDGTTPFPADYEIDYLRVWRQEGTTVYLPLIADGFINSDNPGRNFGEDTLLSIDGSPTKITLLQFDCRHFTGDSIVTPTLHIQTGSHPNDSSEQTISIYLLDPIEWDEETITFNNMPHINSTLIGEVVANSTNTEYEITLDADVLQQGANQIFTLALMSNRDDGLHILSKEADGNRPELILQSLDS